MTDTRPPQVFKNRSAAYDWLRSKGIAVGQTKFYEDCKPHKHNLIQPDKTLRLADLIAYIEAEHRIAPAGPGRDREAEEYARDKAREELRNLQLKNEKLAVETRREDRRWMLRSESEEHEAALIGLLRDALRHRVRIQSANLLRTAGGNPKREPELLQALLVLIDDAFNDLADLDEIEVEFEGEEEFPAEEDADA